MAGFDDLIERLLHEVALTGTQGLSASQFANIVQKYYDEKNPHVTDTTNDDDDDLLFSSKPPVQKTTVDDSLFNTVLEWLCKHPEVEIVEVKTSAAVQTSPDSPDTSPFRQKLDGKRIFVSEERVWLTLTGHGIDHKRIPPREFALLSVVAAAGPRGILQPYAGKLTEQDKRSVPKRTDMLAEKGYIVKEHVIGTGAKTTVLRLKRWTTGEQPLRSMDHPMTDPEKGGNPVIFYDAWYNATVRALKENRGMVAMKDLRLILGTSGRRWETKVLIRCVKRITESGFIRRMTAKYHDKYGNPIRIAGTKRECVAHAIQLLREPTEQDRVTWRSSEPGQKISLENSDDEDEGSGMEDAEGEIEDAEQGTFVAEDGAAVETNKPATPLDIGTISEDDGQVAVEDQADVNGPNGIRIEPQWTPDLPLVNVFHRIVKEAGQKGINAMDLGSRLAGPSWRRPIDQSMLLLTDVGQYSQPAHLKHLAIVRDTAVREKFSHYRYRTKPNFDKAVAAGEATEQKVVAGKGKQKADDVSTALDEWGFPRVLLKDLANRDGRATLMDGRRGIQYDLVVDGNDEDEPQAVKKRRGRPPKHLASASAARNGSVEEPDTTSGVPMVGADDGTVPTTELQDPSAQAVASEVLAKPTRTPKPTFKTRDVAPPSTSQSLHKRGPYRRRRPEERPSIIQIKKREISQHEYDDFDRTAEETAERKVLAEMRARDPANEEITLADLPSDRVAEVKEEILAREKPGIYINPPGARTTKIENFIQLGRPRNALIAVVKTDQLKQLEWFHHDEGPRFAPKASKRRTSRVGQFSRGRKKKTPDLVDSSDSQSDEEDEEEGSEDEDEEGEEVEEQSLPANNESGAPSMPRTSTRIVSTESATPATPTDEPSAKRRQLRPPSVTSRARLRSSVQYQSQPPLRPALSMSSKAGSAMYSRTGSTPRLAANAVDNLQRQDPRVLRIVDSYEQRQQAAARGLAAAMAYDQTTSPTPQPSANGLGLDGQQDEQSTRKSDPEKRKTTASLPPQDLVSDDEFETVASMVGSRPRDLGPSSDAESDGDSDATDEWVPPVSEKAADREQRDTRPATVPGTVAPGSTSMPVETEPATSLASHSITGVEPSNGTMTQFAHPAEAVTKSTTSIAAMEDAPVQAATPVALATPHGDTMTPAQELKMLMAKRGRKSKVDLARMAELNRQIEPEKASTPDLPVLATPRPKVTAPSPAVEEPPMSMHSGSKVETFDKAYVEAHPDEQFHHRGGGRWARGPRDFKIRNDRAPITHHADASPAASPAESAPVPQEVPSNGTASNLTGTTTSPMPNSTHVAPESNPSSSQATPTTVIETFSSGYVDQHPDEDFYHRGQGRWGRGLPPPGYGGRTGVRGPGAQQWKMSILGYGVSVQPKKPSTSSMPKPSTTAMTTRSSLPGPVSSTQSMIVKLPLPQRPSTAADSSSGQLEPKTPAASGASTNTSTPFSLNIVRPYSASPLQIVRPYSSYSSPAALPRPAEPSDATTDTEPSMALRTPAARVVTVPASTPATLTPTQPRAALKSKYKDYPPGTSDDEIFSGDPDLIVMDNLYRLAQKYTMMEIVDRINEGRPEPVSNQPNLSNRLARAITDIAIRQRKPREEVVNDLRMAQQANGVPKNGRRRKTETLLKKVLKQPRRQSDTAASTEPVLPKDAHQSSLSGPSPSESMPPPSTSSPSLKRKRDEPQASAAITTDSESPTSTTSEAADTGQDIVQDLPSEPMVVLSGHDVEMTDAPIDAEADTGHDTNGETDLPADQDAPDPSVGILEDTAKPYNRPITNRTSGSIKAERRKIIIDAVRACNGVFPGDGQPWYVSATVWQRNHGQQPDRRTVDGVVQELVDKKKLKRMTLKFEKNGEEILRHIITEPGVDKSSPQVKDMRMKIIESHPFVYLPPEADISEERRAKAARRFWKDDGGGHTRAGGTGTGRQPVVSIAVQQTKEAAEIEEREAREQGFPNALAYRRHRDALAFERRAKAKALPAQRTRRTSSVSQAQRNDEDVTTANGDEVDLDAEWEPDDQNNPAAQAPTQIDQNELDYAALELAESRIRSSPVVPRDPVRKPKAKPKPRTSAPKGTVRKPLSSIRPSGLGKKTRRSRDVEGYMTLDDMARHHQRAASLMLHPEQLFSSGTGTFGTASIVPDDILPEMRRLRPRPVVETPTVEPEPEPQALPQNEPELGEGRLIAEFSVPEEDDGNGMHMGVCNLHDVLRHAKSIPDTALLGESDNKTDQFFDEVDRVWCWEMQQLEQVNVNPIKAGSFINHTLNKGHTRVTHQTLPNSNGVITSAMSDALPAPTALVRLKVPGLASLGLPSGESGVLGSGAAKTVRISKITGKPKRKYTSRKRKHQELEEEPADSDGEFVPGVERDTSPPIRTRAAALKVKKADIGLAPQRDRKSSKEFKDGNRLVVAFALVAAVCGGINQDRPNWNIIAHALSYRYDGEFLRRRWGHLVRFRKGDADRFRDALHEPFLEAYGKGELPGIDFQNLADTDWPTLFEWAEFILAPLHTEPKDDVAEAPILLESRDETNENFFIDEPAQVFELDPDDYFTTNTDLGRRHLALRYYYGTPLSAEINLDDTMLLQSWIRAVALTKQVNYNADAANKKIKQIATGKALTQVTNAMVDAHVLVQDKKGRHLPGRNFHIHDDVLRQFRRWPAKAELPEHTFLRMVAHSWHNINVHLQNNDSLDLLPALSDPDYLVLENMTAKGLIEMTMDLPDVTWDFDAPGQKLSPWGYGGANYETKRVRVETLRFPIKYKRTAAYPVDHGLRTGVPVPLQAVPVPGEAGVRIPLWVDIHGILIDDVWDMVLRSVLHLIVFRPGATATSIQKSHSDKLWAWEIELVLQWMDEVGIADRWGGEEKDGAWKGGYRASGWWYCAFLPEIATWQAPMGAEYGS